VRVDTENARRIIEALGDFGAMADEWRRPREGDCRDIDSGEFAAGCCREDPSVRLEHWTEGVVHDRIA
jgi:hypothetical protein